MLMCHKQQLTFGWLNAFEADNKQKIKNEENLELCMQLTT
jgi:hypothetical protein